MGRAIIQNFVQDGAGNALPAIQVTIKIAESATIASLFDVSGNALGNPITTGDRGYFSAYVAAGEYDLYIDAPGGQIVVPNVSAIDADDYAALEVRVLALEATASQVADGSALDQLASTDAGKGTALVSYAISAAETAAGLTEADIIQPQYPPMNAARYGVVGAGSDDGPAFTKAFTVLRSAWELPGAGAPSHFLGKVTAPPGLVCIIETSIDATNLRRMHWELNLSGTLLVGKTSGRGVIDLIQSRWGHFREVNIFGDATTPPRFGIQMGRGSGTSAGEFLFENVTINGWFSTANFYNLAGEVIFGTGCTFYNYMTTGTTYNMVNDGTNSFSVVSDYFPVTIAANTGVSFTVQEWLGCDFRRQTGSGGNVYNLRVMGLTMTGYLSTQEGANIIQAFEATASEMRDHSYKVHFESRDAASPGVERTMVFQGIANPEMNGLHIHADRMHCVDEVFLADPGVTLVTINNLTLGIQSYRSGNPTNGVFNPVAKFAITGGDIFTPAGSLPRPAVFNAIVKDGTAAGFKLFGPAAIAFTPSVTFQTVGDFAPTYTTRIGYYQRIGSIVFLSIQLLFDSNAYTTASGAFRITGLPFSGLAAVGDQALAISRFSNVDLAAGRTALGANVVAGANRIQFYENGDNVVSAGSAIAAIPASVSGFRLELSGFMFIDPAS